MDSHEAVLESSEIIIGQQFWSSIWQSKPCTVEAIERHLMSGMRERMQDEFYGIIFPEHFEANRKNISPNLRQIPLPLRDFYKEICK